MKLKLITTEDYCMHCDGYPRSLYPNGRGTRHLRKLPCIAAIPDDSSTEYPMLEFLADGPYCIYCIGEQLYHEISYKEPKKPFPVAELRYGGLVPIDEEETEPELKTASRRKLMEMGISERLAKLFMKARTLKH